MRDWDLVPPPVQIRLNCGVVHLNQKDSGLEALLKVMDHSENCHYLENVLRGTLTLEESTFPSNGCHLGLLPNRSWRRLLSVPDLTSGNPEERPLSFERDPTRTGELP